MKGPGLRRKLDVRRLWRCAACGSALPSGGNVTSMRCQCEKPRPFMQLVEPRRTARPESEPLDVYFECGPLDEEQTPAPATDDIDAPVAVHDGVEDSAGERGTAVEPHADEIVTTETTEITQEAATIEERAPERSATADAGPSATERPPTTADRTPSSGESNRRQGQRKRRSRGARRKRGRRRASGGGTNTGPESRAGGPES